MDDIETTHAPHWYPSSFYNEWTACRLPQLNKNGWDNLALQHVFLFGGKKGKCRNVSTAYVTPVFSTAILLTKTKK